MRARCAPFCSGLDTAGFAYSEHACSRWKGKPGVLQGVFERPHCARLDTRSCELQRRDGSMGYEQSAGAPCVGYVQRPHDLPFIANACMGTLCAPCTLQRFNLPEMTPELEEKFKKEKLARGGCRHMACMPHAHGQCTCRHGMLGLCQTSWSAPMMVRPCALPPSILMRTQLNVSRAPRHQETKGPRTNSLALLSHLPPTLVFMVSCAWLVQSKQLRRRCWTPRTRKRGRPRKSVRRRLRWGRRTAT